MASNKTDKLRLNTWLESEPVDFEEINSNFEIIDNLILISESNTTTAAFTLGGSNTTATWRYKKYSDGTIDMCASIPYLDLRCSTGSASPYNSDISKISFPFSLKEINNIQMHLSSSNFAWIFDCTDDTVVDSISFKVMTFAAETAASYKKVFINVKGVLVDG